MWVFPKIGVFSQIIHFDRVFHYKPSILWFSLFFGNTHMVAQQRLGWFLINNWCNFLREIFHRCETYICVYIYIYMFFCVLSFFALWRFWTVICFKWFSSHNGGIGIVRMRCSQDLILTTAIFTIRVLCWVTMSPSLLQGVCFSTTEFLKMIVTWTTLTQILCNYSSYIEPITSWLVNLPPLL